MGDIHRAQKATKAKKFDLQEESAGEEEFGGLTHMGQSINEMDDFKEDIARSEDEYPNDKDEVVQRTLAGG